MLKELNYKNTVKISAWIFVILEIILFPLIQIPPADISAVSSYMAIVLVAVFALVTWRGERDGHLIRLGILFILEALDEVFHTENGQVGELFLVLVLARSTHCDGQVGVGFQEGGEFTELLGAGGVG